MRLVRRAGVDQRQHGAAQRLGPAGASAGVGMCEEPDADIGATLSRARREPGQSKSGKCPRSGT